MKRLIFLVLILLLYSEASCQIKSKINLPTYYFYNCQQVFKNIYLYEAVDSTSNDTIRFIVEKNTLIDSIFISDINVVNYYKIEKECISKEEFILMFGMRQEFSIMIDDKIVLSTDLSYYRILTISKVKL